MRASIEPFIRKAFLPKVSEGDGVLKASKFSGKPWLNKGDRWPNCQHCGQPMQLFVQINLDSLPKSLKGEFGTGLLQLFYCTNTDSNCEVECAAWSPFAKSTLVRIIQADTEVRDIEIPNIKNYFPPKQIVGWEEIQDYPNCSEGTELGIDLTDDEWDEIAEQYPQPGDKLSGWPLWVQGLEYPDCPVCNQEMRLVFQLDSEDNLPFMFGDAGCGQITQCKAHKTQVAFGWACS
ncbi:MAG: DUF1963 domain-containing protein [Scytonema sp. PMC 1069.18]|nr:DUF1963 domain-containing protein [Scytonema sp. PMC 1069.18]MEC4886791.1 DUF1963 domain-containing protein [Scytonema sp. PMC 1070.18]